MYVQKASNWYAYADYNRMLTEGKLNPAEHIPMYEDSLVALVECVECKVIGEGHQNTWKWEVLIQTSRRVTEAELKPYLTNPDLYTLQIMYVRFESAFVEMQLKPGPEPQPPLTETIEGKEVTHNVYEHEGSYGFADGSNRFMNWSTWGNDEDYYVWCDIEKKEDALFDQVQLVTQWHIANPGQWDTVYDPLERSDTEINLIRSPLLPLQQGFNDAYEDAGSDEEGF